MKNALGQNRRAIRRSIAAIARSYLILLVIFGSFLLFLVVLVIAERFLLGLA